MPDGHRYPDFRDLPQRPDLRDLVSAVESLGLSCEPGLVQRHCHAEPLGLFRFGLTPLAGLIDALDSSFADIADPGCLGLYEGYGGEWITVHRRYGFEFHTAHLKQTFSEDAVRSRMAKHFSFLADKLLQDLREGTKIFAYRPDIPQPVGSDAEALMRSMRAHGDPTLLWVTTSADEAEVGTVRWSSSSNIMVGFLDRYAEVTFAAGASYEARLRIVQAAIALKSPAADTPEGR